MFLETAGEVEVDGGVADASLAMALAYCDLGGEAMDDQPQRIMQGCAALQAAITLLRAPELQRNTVAVTLLSDLDTTLQVRVRTDTALGGSIRGLQFLSVRVGSITRPSAGARGFCRGRECLREAVTRHPRCTRVAQRSVRAN